MTERFRMPMTWEMDRAGPLWVDLYITHAWAPEDFLLQRGFKLAGDALRCNLDDPAHVCINRYVNGVYLFVCFVPGFRPKSSQCVNGNAAIWHLVLTTFALCVVPLEAAAEE